MAEVSGNDEKKVSRVNSLTKVFRSPLRSPGRNTSSPKTKRSSSNPFSRFGNLFHRKDSRKGKADADSSSSSDDEAEAEPRMSLSSIVEPAKEKAESLVHAIHVDQHKGEANPPAMSTETSTETNNKKENVVTKTVGRIEKTMGDLIHDAEGVLFGKVKEVSDEKIKSPLNEAKVTSIVVDNDQVKEQAKVVIDTIVQSSDKKEETPKDVKEKEHKEKKEETPKEVKQEEKNEGLVVKEKEGDCVSSLAQGLHSLCAPWDSKKKEN